TSPPAWRRTTPSSSTAVTRSSAVWPEPPADTPISPNGGPGKGPLTHTDPVPHRPSRRHPRNGFRDRSGRAERSSRVKVDISHLRRLMAQTCARAGIPADRADLVVAHYLDGELRGKPSHGVAKFCFESQFFAQRTGSPSIVREYGALAVVDAQREVGPLSADYAVDLAVARAREHGAGIIGMINTQRYGILASWPERMAEHGMVGIAMNTSRAEATVAGGRTAVLGVNPLAFAFPTTDGSVSADMSTTLAPMGVLWEARRAGTRLPDGCFVDAHGEPTDDPEAARTAVVFGDHRGFALSLLIQVLTGSLFGFPMGDEVSD